MRLIDEAGGQVGIVPLAQALETARERELDLVEVAPSAEPPVCRLLDFGKYLYEQTKKHREARRHQKATLVKEVRFRPKIDDHDIAFKQRQVERFLREGDKVKIMVRFRGREIAHPQLGMAILTKIAEALQDLAAVEKAAEMEGRSLTMVLAPAKHGKDRGDGKET